MCFFYVHCCVQLICVFCRNTIENTLLNISSSRSSNALTFIYEHETQSSTFEMHLVEDVAPSHIESWLASFASFQEVVGEKAQELRRSMRG